MRFFFIWSKSLLFYSVQILEVDDPWHELHAPVVMAGIIKRRLFDFIIAFEATEFGTSIVQFHHCDRQYCSRQNFTNFRLVKSKINLFL